MQKGIVAAKLPVAIGFHNTAHLTVGRGFAKFTGATEGQMDAKVHHALVVGGVIEFGIAHRAGQIAKEERRTLFVIPHMRTGAHAAAAVIVVSLPAK